MGEDDVYIGEPDLTEVDSLDGDEEIRIIDSVSGSQYSANTAIDTLVGYVLSQYESDDLHDFSTMSDPTGASKTFINGLNSLLGHFEVRTITGKTNTSGDLTTSPIAIGEIFLGGIATCNNTICRCYVYTPAAGANQLIHVVNAATSVVKSKSVTVKALIFKLVLEDEESEEENTET